MPIAILRPTGPGTLTEWSASGAPTNWQAVLAADAAFVYGRVAGTRDRYTMEDLPADATGVTSVTAILSAAGQNLGGAFTMRLSILLAGTESSGPAFAPLDGAYLPFAHVFATAPGGLPWTVPRVNALEPGPDVVDTTSGDLFLVDEVWLVVDYTSAVAVPFEGERQAVVLTGGARGFVGAPGARADLVLPVHRIRIPAGPAAD